MSEYSSIFDARGGHYNHANELLPDARREEAGAILCHLNLPLASTRAWLDVAAGGGYLSRRACVEGFGREVVSYDASLPFLSEASGPGRRAVGSYANFPFADGSFGASACLAAFHHIQDAGAVVAEMLRVSEAGGRAAVGDVAVDSPAAHFLNGFVNRRTETGHCGRFRSGEELESIFRSAGAGSIRVEERELAWHFPSEGGATTFCRELFGLEEDTQAPEIEDEVAALGGVQRDGEFLIPWRMVFASGER